MRVRQLDQRRWSTWNTSRWPWRSWDAWFFSWRRWSWSQKECSSCSWHRSFCRRRPTPSFYTSIWLDPWCAASFPANAEVEASAWGLRLESSLDHGRARKRPQRLQIYNDSPTLRSSGRFWMLRKWRNRLHELVCTPLLVLTIQSRNSIGHPFCKYFLWFSVGSGYSRLGNVFLRYPEATSKDAQTVLLESPLNKCK